MERLSKAINKTVAAGRWKGAKIGRSTTPISHLFDDLFLFAKADTAHAEVICRILGEFCVSSGQKVNSNKSLL